jgi:DNA-3-methyladenine glycosylase II
MSSDVLTFNSGNVYKLCDKLAKSDRDLAVIIKQYGYPPMWTRPASFQSLVLFILEQQVSLASAYAAFKKTKGQDRVCYPGKDPGIVR